MKARISLLALSLLLASPAAWGAGDVKLITGLDGGDYQTYRAPVMKMVQAQLVELGLYKGPIDGKLNQDTFEALAQFQKEQRVVITGIPTPQTRKLLEGAASSSERERPSKSN